MLGLLPFYYIYATKRQTHPLLLNQALSIILLKYLRINILLLLVVVVVVVVVLVAAVAAPQATSSAATADSLPGRDGARPRARNRSVFNDLGVVSSGVAAVTAPLRAADNGNPNATVALPVGQCIPKQEGMPAPAVAAPIRPWQARGGRRIPKPGTDPGPASTPAGRALRACD